MHLIQKKIDLNTARFTQNEVVERTGVDTFTIQNLVKRGQVPVEGPALGKGRPRLHSFENLLRIKLIGMHGTWGIPVSFTRKFADAMVGILEERQRSGYLFDWNERYILQLDRLDQSFEPDKVLYWEEWGILTSDIGIVDTLDKDDEAAHVRGRKTFTEYDEIRIDPTDADLETPLTHEEYCALARDGYSERPSYLVIPIGYIVNALVFGHEGEVD